MILTYILCGVIVLLSVIHYFERKDLYNRIMGKNLTEYKVEKAHSVKTAHRRVVNKWRGRDGENR